jgi:hypothetical protein
MSELPTARLHAIIAVDFEKAVRCHKPGCGHRVYAAVHVVQENGRFLVLGSSCFAELYGGPMALGTAGYGSGTPRKLSDTERALLEANTAALIAHFEQEEQARLAEENRRLAEQKAIAEREAQLRLARYKQATAPTQRTPIHRPTYSPWPWQSSRNTSIAALMAPDGKTWVRVQHHDGSQKLVPWPAFPGWDAALPPEIGAPDLEVQGYAVKDIVHAMRMLASMGFSVPKVGGWRDVLPK